MHVAGLKMLGRRLQMIEQRAKGRRHRRQGYFPSLQSGRELRAYRVSMGSDFR